MGLLNLASGISVWRGYEYYQIPKKVTAIQKCSETEFKGTVSGSNGEQYEVFIDIAHPRKSHCSCPHANGRRIICKHMVALYFTVFPEEAKTYYQQVLDDEEESEREQEELEEAVVKYVSRMKKDELRQALLELLFDGPEWQYERFVREHVDVWE